MSLFKRHFDGGSRPVKVYFQSGVDAQFVADLQRMVTTRGGDLAEFPKFADVIVMLKSHTDLGSVTFDLYANDPTKAIVSEQWIVQSCLHGLLWGPTWGGFRVFPPPELEPQEIPNQRSANMGLDPHAVRTRTPEGLAAPPPQQAPPPNQGPARAPRPPSRQAVAPPIKKEYPPEIIDVDALSSSSGSEASDEEDEDTDLYETDDDHVPQRRYRARRKRAAASRWRPTRATPARELRRASPASFAPMAPLKRVPFRGAEYKEMAEVLALNPEALYTVPNGGSKEAVRARTQLWNTYALTHKDRRGQSYYNGHKNHMHEIEDLAKEIIAKKRRRQRSTPSTSKSASVPLSTATTAKRLSGTSSTQRA